MTAPTCADWVARAPALRLKRSGGELKGPCPSCHGRDRFSVARGTGGRGVIYCRRCDPGRRNPDAYRAIMDAAGFDLPDGPLPASPARRRRPVRTIIPTDGNPAWYAAQIEALRIHLACGTARKADDVFRDPAVRMYSSSSVTSSPSGLRRPPACSGDRAAR